MPGNLYKRPMFRKGGSAEGGITSGLQAPRQGYQGTGNASDQNVQKFDTNQNIADFLRNASIGDQQRLVEQLYPQKPRTDYSKRRLGDLMIDFGIDIASRTPTGSGISGAISTALAAAKDPFEKFKASRAGEEATMDIQADNLDDRRAGMFKSLIEGQSDILAEKTGNTSGVELQKVEVIQDIVPKLYDLREKVEKKTATKDDLMNIDIYERTLNNLQKKDPITQATLDIFVQSNDGEMLFSKISKKLLNEDNIAGGEKYGGDKSNDQLRIDALQEMRKVIETTFRAEGGRIGYAQGEMVEEQVTETMDQGPMAQSDNPISYDQLRARLPNEITDDIVELMANSAEALEDFAMISSQQDVDLFNQKYSVNLVLPSEA
jgi:hypothetical protein